MTFWNQISVATNSVGRAISLFRNPKVSRYFLLPLVINALLLALVVWGSVVLGSFLVDNTLAYLGIDEGSWTGILAMIMAFIIRILVYLVYFIVYKYLILIVLSPFLSLLSEAVDHLESGKEFPFSWSQLAKDMGRSIVINLRNFCYEMLLTLLLSLVAFIPLVGLVSPFVIIGVQAYFFGYAMMDYNAERYRFKSKDTNKWMRHHKWTVMAVGLIFYGSFLVPFIGWVVAPILGTAVGTLAFLKLEKEHPLPFIPRAF